MAPDAPLTLEWLPGRYAVCRLDASAPLPRWASEDAPARLLSITRTEREVSIVIDESLLPDDVTLDANMPIQRGFIALRIKGTLDFNLVGVLAKLTAAVAATDISVFVISTYDTDLLLMREEMRLRAETALRSVAHFL